MFEAHYFDSLILKIYQYSSLFPAIKKLKNLNELIVKYNITS